MWNKIKKALTGADKVGFHNEMIELIHAGQPFDPQAIADKFKISASALPAEARKATVDANRERWDELANSRKLSIANEAERLTQIGLGRNFTHSILSEYAKFRIDRLVQEIMADGIVEPSEDARLRSEAEALGVDLPNSIEMEEARKVWHAANGPLPHYDPPLLLKRGEICHQACAATAFEDRTRTVRVNYGGPSARVRLAKGIYYSVGSMRVQSQKEEYSHELGSGVLCATNNRLLFVSPSKSISVPLGKIIQYESYSDGVKIYKDTGKPLTFVFPKVSKIDVIRCVRVIEECR